MSQQIDHPSVQAPVAGTDGAVGPDTSADLPWRAGHVSKGPALIVLAIVAVIIIGGVLLATLGSTRAATPEIGHAAAGLAAERATGPLAPITVGGLPPADVVGSLAIPGGSLRHGTANHAAGLTAYDRSARFSLDVAPARVVAFYRAELHRDGWGHVDVYAAASGQGTQLFARRAGSDGYYWQVGVRVRQLTGSVSAALAGARPGARTSFVIRLEQVGDAS